MQPLTPKRARFRHALLGGSAALAVCLAGGCRQSAYTELYVQELNNEARQLEDRVYEYDAAYRRLETELEVLQHDNAQLRTALAVAEHEGPDAGGRSLLGRPGGREPIDGRRNPRGRDEVMPLPRRAQPGPGQEADAPEDATELPVPGTPPGPVIPDPFESQRSEGLPPLDSELVPPEIEFGVPPGALIQPMSPGFSAAEMPVDRSVVRQASVLISEQSGEEATAEESLATEESLVSVQPAVAAIAALPRDVEDVDQFRIVVSAADADAIEAASESNSDSTDIEGDAEGVVVSLALHPAFTSAFDADGDGIEEGLKVLVQPKTDAGEIVAVEGELTVVAVDPIASASRPADNPKRLGRWTFDAAALAQLYDPIGSAAGYHLQFSPLEATPTGGQVAVFVRLETPDGRKLVNRVTLPVRTAAGAAPVWTPRVSAQ